MTKTDKPIIVKPQTLDLRIVCVSLAWSIRMTATHEHLEIKTGEALCGFSVILLVKALELYMDAPE